MPGAGCTGHIGFLAPQRPISTRTIHARQRLIPIEVSKVRFLRQVEVLPVRSVEARVVFAPHHREAVIPHGFSALGLPRHSSSAVRHALEVKAERGSEVWRVQQLLTSGLQRSHEFPSTGLVEVLTVVVMQPRVVLAGRHSEVLVPVAHIY